MATFLTPLRTPKLRTKRYPSLVQPVPLYSAIDASLDAHDVIGAGGPANGHNKF